MTMADAMTYRVARPAYSASARSWPNGLQWSNLVKSLAWSTTEARVQRLSSSWQRSNPGRTIRIDLSE
jgi:hypothetical protein